MSIEHSFSQPNRPKGEYISRGIITVKELLGELPLQPNMDPSQLFIWDEYDSHTIKEYNHLGELPLITGIVRHGDDPHTEYVAEGMGLNAFQINTIMYAAAPNKMYGLDLGDITGDWHTLFHSEYEFYKDLLERHRKMEGWQLFEGRRHGIERVLNEWKEDRSKGLLPNPNTTLKPSIRLLESDDGTITWNLASFSSPVDPLLGMTYVAAYSPDITDTWGTYNGFEEGDNTSQSMGSTQVCALVTRYHQQLLEGQLGQRMIEYFQQL